MTVLCKENLNKGERKYNHRAQISWQLGNPSATFTEFCPIIPKMTTKPKGANKRDHPII